MVEKRLVLLKAEFPLLSDISSVILQQTLRDQQTAFKNFWEGRAKYSKFKKKHARQSIRLTKAAFFYEEWATLYCKIKNAFKYSME